MLNLEWQKKNKVLVTGVNMTAQYEMRDFEIDAFNQSQSAKIISIRKKRLEKENAKKIAFHNFVNMLYSVMIVVMIAGLFSTYIYRNSLVNEAKYEIFNLKAEIKSKNAQIEELSANIENQTELKNIEQIAKASLNMQYPSAEQIVYIDSNYHFALATRSPESESQAKVQFEPSNKPVLKQFVASLFNANK